MIDEFSQMKLPLTWAEGQTSNLEPRDNIRITDVAPIVRLVGDHAELSMTKWSWPGPGNKPVFNFRSDGRDFTSSIQLLDLPTGFGDVQNIIAGRYQQSAVGARPEGSLWRGSARPAG